jgi:hypothetical protein
MNAVGTSRRSLTVALRALPAIGAAEELRTDIPPLIEIDRLDPEGARIERIAFTARGMMAREVPIPNSQNRFCTLSYPYNVALHYYPDRDEWVFQVQSNESAQFAAGGVAVCLNLSASADKAAE